MSRWHEVEKTKGRREADTLTKGEINPTVSDDTSNGELARIPCDQTMIVASNAPRRGIYFLSTASPYQQEQRKASHAQDSFQNAVLMQIFRSLPNPHNPKSLDLPS